MAEIITIGEILVEVMRKKVDVPLDEPGEFVGPFPSGAPAIFIDAVARLGKSSGIIGSVGEDDFGNLVTSRLDNDNVNISQVKELKDEFTGTAFVTYFGDGTRKFLYHVGKSAAGDVKPEDVSEDFVRDSSALHITGSALTMCDSMREACYKAVDLAEDSDTLISFDPNVRVETIEGVEFEDIAEPIIEVSDLLSPGADELKVATGIENEGEAVDKMLNKGVECVAIKLGDEGCRIYTEDREIKSSSFKIDEVDPTGAGDAFSAALLVGWMEDMGIEKLARFANAVGAKTVSKQGPMEGLPWREDVEEILKHGQLD